MATTMTINAKCVVTVAPGPIVSGERCARFGISMGDEEMVTVMAPWQVRELVALLEPFAAEPASLNEPSTDAVTHLIAAMRTLALVVDQMRERTCPSELLAARLNEMYASLQAAEARAK